MLLRAREGDKRDSTAIVHDVAGYMRIDTVACVCFLSAVG